MAKEMSASQALSRMYNIARGTVAAPPSKQLSRIYNIARGMASPSYVTKEKKAVGGKIKAKKKMMYGGKAMAKKKK